MFNSRGHTLSHQQYMSALSSPQALRIQTNLYPLNPGAQAVLLKSYPRSHCQAHEGNTSRNFSLSRLTGLQGLRHAGGCQNYGPFLGTPKYSVRHYNRDPRRGHNFDNHPCVHANVDKKDRESTESAEFLLTYFINSHDKCQSNFPGEPIITSFYR